jgi:4-hydroxy 2-oxovalerate aldolase
MFRRTEQDIFMAIRILDCTLRDGGYYNNWCYPRPLVERYLQAMAAARVDIVEIGFRNFAQDTFLGPYAYTTDAFLESLAIPPGIALAAMIDAKTALGSGHGCAAAIDMLFAPRLRSKIEWVRIAAHFAEIERAAPIAERLHALGYRVGLNMMQAAGRSDQRIAETAARVAGWGTVEVLYFADSFGAMDAREVERVIAAIRAGWPHTIGIHTHNNKSLAVQNSFAAIAAGVEFVDATVLGMGRGAGNAETEILLCELQARGQREADIAPLAALCVEEFQPLKERHQWGAGFFYHYSALNNIHPMFAQTLIGDKRYSAREKFSALRALAERNATSFSRSEFARSLHSFGDTHPLDPATPAANLDEFHRADVLLVGAGESTGQYARDIELFIRDHGPLVLTLNHQAAIDIALVDGIICVDQYRLLSEAEFLAGCDKPIYSARRFQDDSTRARLAGAALHEYDCVLEEGKFSALPNGCVIPVPLAFAYALALCIAGGARRVFLVGFDGFHADDSRQTEMLHLLRLVEPQCAGIDITALTPTSYPVRQGSLYASYKKHV